MLRQNINSFDLVKRNQLSKVWSLSYPHDAVSDSQKPEDVIPFVKTFQFLITEKNEIPYVQFKFTQNKNIVNDSEIINKWTYERVPGGIVKWVTLVKNMKNIDKYIDFELPVCVMYNNPSSMSLKITADRCLLLLLWDHVTTLNNHGIFNPEVQHVIMMDYRDKKKNIINLFINILSMYYFSIIKGGFYMLRNLLSNAGLILGTIFPYYKEDEPTNFLICNGQSCIGYEIEDIGITKVPDLRGKFTRMIGGNSLGIGIEQGDCIRNIQGSINTDTYTSGYAIYNQSISTYPNGVIRNGTRKQNWNGFQISQGSGSHESFDLIFDASFVVPTGPENRPINMAFNYIIYVGRKKKTHELISFIKSLFNNEVMIYA